MCGLTPMWVGYGVGAVLLVVLCLAPVWIRTALHEYHNYDLGIFAQALHHIRLGDLNPFVPALNIPIFSDHFDPILILAAPVARLLEPAYAGLAIEHVLILLMPLPLLWGWRKDPRATSFICFAIVYLFFNRGMLSAIAFPVHPTTWAGFFMVGVGVSVKRRRWGWLLLSSILLMACKEEFPFAVLMLAGGLAWQRRYRMAGCLGLLALAWGFVAFGVRPMVLAHTTDYASRILSPLFSAPVATLWSRLRNLGEAKNLLRSAVPLLPVVYWQVKHKRPMDWRMLFMALPLLAIRFIDESWGFHYLAPVAPLMLLACWGDNRPRVPWKIAILGMVITLLAGASPLRKSVMTYGRIADLRGPRREAIENARAHLLSHPQGRALVQGNLAPLLARRDGVFQFGGVQPKQPYRYTLLEKPPAGDPWPLTHADVERSIAQWRRNTNLIVWKDDDHLFFAERRIAEVELDGAGADDEK